MSALQVCGLLLLCCVTFSACYDYKTALTDSLLFYEAQRSGKLPSDQRVTWRKDSALNDKGNNGEDLTGGYYDAGDFVKFGFPMAYTVTVLSWGVIEYQDVYSSTGNLDYARKAIKWGTDYFLKAHVSANELYGQVGQGSPDHSYWGRPEDMTMARPAYKITASSPGSDLAGETAAALAAASIVLKSTDASYAANLLNHAKQLFDFANNHRGIYSDAISDASGFYRSSSYADELVWAAVWLYKATNDNSYLTKAESLYEEGNLGNSNGGFDWDTKTSGVEILMSEISKNSIHKTKAKSYLDYMINSQQKTPKGLLYIDQWGTLRHANNVAFLLLEAVRVGIGGSSYTSFAKSQVDYALGSTGRSFVIGYGSNYPTHAQHRSSSCPDAPATCDWGTYSGTQPNAHILYGAMVGGPDSNDGYSDVRSDYVHNEVACDYNAAYQGALAALIKLGQ
uniref:Endoglucanase n=1 Tax=Aretaon asperrimus TaxID=173775 RepID=A0A125SKY0_9NEOP|nr:glycoside hydrolase family 9 [Aretaon asperrimus]